MVTARATKEVYGAPMLKRGDKVYRVCDYTAAHNEKNAPEWRVEMRVVKSVGKCITLVGYFPGLWRRVFDLGALGRTFHESREAAYKAFSEQQDKELLALERHREKAVRAKQWAFGEYRKASS